MDIGTGKDLADYVVNGKQIPYHLIDICNPGDKYNVFEYQHDFHKAFEEIRKKGKLPILCGGTGMYIESVLRGFKLLDVPQNPALRESLKGKSLAELEQILASYKVLHNKTDVDSAQRAIRAIEIEEFYKTEAPDKREYAPINSLIIGVDIDRELRREKISRRLRARLDEGMVDEVRAILATGVKPFRMLSDSSHTLPYRSLAFIVTRVPRADEEVILTFAPVALRVCSPAERRSVTIINAPTGRLSELYIPYSQTSLFAQTVPGTSTLPPQPAANSAVPATNTATTNTTNTLRI